MYAQDYEWLWNGTIVIGEVTLLVGDSGVGKGFTVAEIISAVTTGRQLPRDETLRCPRSAVMIGLEEDPACTTVHKLQAAGADLARVIDLSEVDSTSEYSTSATSEFRLPENLPELRKVLVQQRGEVGLVVIDPFTAVTSVSLSGNRGARDIMGALRNLARDFGIAILVVHHPVKGRSAAGGTGLSIKDRIGGSKGITDAARLVLGLDKDPESGQRLLSVIKSNISAADATPYRFQLSKGWPMRVEWLEEISETEDTDAMREPAEGTEARKLLDTLRANGGPMNPAVAACIANVKYTTARVNLSRLKAGGFVVATDRGMWAATLPVVTPADVLGKGEDNAS